MSAQSTPPADPNAPPVPAKKRSAFAFFFKSALGCTAFAFGVLVVIVLLLPTIASGPIKGIVSDGFADNYYGRLEIADVDLSWFSEQTLDGVVVRDPEGKEVVRASAVLPSIIGLMGADDGKIGRVSLEVDADLVQDDAGVTNLQRALAERKPSTAPPDVPSSDSGDPFAMLERLDVDLDVKSKKLTWSDKETRRLGIPFEVRDLVATVKARPGAPIAIHADGKIVSEKPGALKVDATLSGPIDSKKPWPFGKVDAEVRIEGFSTAMIDGVANQRGNLVEVLGPRFTFTAKANGLSTTAGTVDVALDGERAGMALIARFEDGVLRSGEKAGFLATFPAPRGYLKHYVDANLPSGTTLALDAGTEPWTITATTFAIPLPQGGAADVKTLAPTFERAELDLRVGVPSSFAFENESTKKAGVNLAVRAIRGSVKLAPGEPLGARLEASLDSGTAGNLVVDVTARDAWKKLGAGELPIVDLDVKVNDLSTAAIGALSGQAERMSSALGSTLQCTVEAKNVSLDAGSIHVSIVGREGQTTRTTVDLAARVEGGRALIDGTNKLSVRLSPSPEWLAKEIEAVAPPGSEIVVSAGQDAITLEATDVVVPMPDAKGGDYMAAVRKAAAGTVTLRVAGASYADPTLKAANTRVATSGIAATAKLEAGGALKVDARGDFQQGSSGGKFAVDASTTDAFEFAAPGGAQAMPSIDASVVVTNLPSALVDAFVQHKNVVERALGDKLSLALYAKGASTKSGTIRAEVEAPNAKLSLGGRVDAGVFKASGEDSLHVEVRVPADVLRDELAASLPPDTTLKWPNGVAAITLDVRDISAVLSQPGVDKPFDLGATLDGLSARVNLALAGVGFENAQTKQLKIDAAVRDIVVEANFAPKAPATVKMRANLSPGRDAKFALDATLADPFAAVKGAPMKPVDAKIELTGLDTNVIDALAGQDGAIAGLLGPELKVEVSARNASASSGTLVVDAVSSGMNLHAGAHFDEAGLHVDGKESIELRITPTAQYVEGRLSKMLPAGTRLKLANDAGPLVVKVRDVSLPMPKANEETTALQKLAQVAFVLEADLPGLVYSDAATDAAQKPVTVSGVHLASTFAPNAPPFVKLTGKIVDDPAGEITADVRALDPLTKLADAQGRDTFRAKIDVRASRLPTAIVDVLAHQQGLLVEALGPRLELTLNAPEITLQSGTFQVGMLSDLHGVKGKGHIEQGTVVIDEIDGLVATVGLGPVMSKRVVGKLVPTLVNVTKPSGAAPAKFSVDALRFPLDGDLRKLDGTVRVDLGEVNYSLFPKLAGFFNAPASASALKIPAITVPIKKGVAGYSRLPVMIAGREYIFSGTYDIVTDAAQLTANIPVNALSKKVSGELEKLREYIDPNMTVPLTIKGSLMNPSIGVDDKALMKVIKDAGEKALEGAAGGLLDDLLKKKKKKD